MAGVAVELERALPGRDERPADVFLPTWRANPLAIDFTVVTPDRPSASGADGATIMDRAARAKDTKSASLCLAAGWDFFVGETYGAL